MPSKLEQIVRFMGVDFILGMTPLGVKACRLDLIDNQFEI